MIHFRTRRMADLDATMFNRLKELTNDTSRGDLQDNGVGAGSSMRSRIEDHVWGGIRFNDHVWATLAYDWYDLFGWSMLTKRVRDYAALVPASLHDPVGMVGFYVRPSHRRRGMGRSLIEATSEVARKNGIRRLLANPWNKSSHSFFEAVGFQTVVPYFGTDASGVSVLVL